MRTLLIGIDSGTQSTKVLVVEAKSGKVLAAVSEGYDLIPNLVETVKGVAEKEKDVFIGVAKPKMVSKEMIAAMNKNSIVLPLSNPVGEIDVADAIAAGAAVAADGRTINNALAYPALFRGALDVRAKDITFEMQLAAAKTLASLAAEGDLLPDVLDRNVHRKTAEAVAKAWKE